MQVGLFVTCLVDLMRPRVGFAALELLQAAGCAVTVPAGQTCCGQPAYNYGDAAGARRLALKVLREFQDCDYVTAPSGSCAAVIRVHYPKLFVDRPEAADIDRLAARTYELTHFLTEVAHWDRPSTFAGTFTYHDSCSGLRELGIRAQPRALLKRLPQARLIEMQEPGSCCGFGGAFALKFGAIATRMADNKCAQLAATGADTLVAGDLGCLLHLEGRLRRQGNEKIRVLHVAEALAGIAGAGQE